MSAREIAVLAVEALKNEEMRFIEGVTGTKILEDG